MPKRKNFNMKVRKEHGLDRSQLKAKYQHDSVLTRSELIHWKKHWQRFKKLPRQTREGSIFTVQELLEIGGEKALQWYLEKHSLPRNREERPE